MKNLFKYIGVFCLMLFSFYYASYIADFMQSKTNLMEEIKDNTKDKNIKSVDAIIDSDYIIPGLNGISVNTKASFSNMLKVGIFNEEYLIFDEVKPAISLDDHLDKIIKKDNYLKNSVISISKASAILPNKTIVKCLFLFSFSAIMTFSLFLYFISALLSNRLLLHALKKSFAIQYFTFRFLL